MEREELLKIAKEEYSCSIHGTARAFNCKECAKLEIKMAKDERFKGW